MPAHVRGYLFNATYSLTHPLFENHHIAYCYGFDSDELTQHMTIELESVPFVVISLSWAL